jgi:hypothetical protein
MRIDHDRADHHAKDLELASRPKDATISARAITHYQQMIVEQRETTT